MTSPGLALLDSPRRLASALPALRRRLLERLRTPASASELAREFGMPRQRLNYHLRVLEEQDLVELVELRPRRGFTERVLRTVGRGLRRRPGRAAGRRRSRRSPPPRRNPGARGPPASCAAGPLRGRAPRRRRGKRGAERRPDVRGGRAPAAAAAHLHAGDRGPVRHARRRAPLHRRAGGGGRRGHGPVRHARTAGPTGCSLPGTRRPVPTPSRRPVQASMTDAPTVAETGAPHPIRGDAG